MKGENYGQTRTSSTGPTSTKDTSMSTHRLTKTNADTTSPPAQLPLTPLAQTLPTSATLGMNEAVARRKAAGSKTIHLGFGEAAFPLHPLLKTAFAEAATRTSYAPVLGIPALRQSIAAYLTSRRAVAYSTDQVVVGGGSKPPLKACKRVQSKGLLLPIP